MENFEILNAETSIQSKEVYAGKTIRYNFMHTNAVGPSVILFSVTNSEEEPEYLNGSYHPHQDQMDVRATNYTGNQGELLDYIYDRCQEIVLAFTPEIPEIPVTE